MSGLPLTDDIRRVVTVVDKDGKAKILFDGANPHKRVRPQRGTVSRLVWSTKESPADVGGDTDRGQVEVPIAPPRGGSIFRIVDIPPITPEIEALPKDYHALQHGEGTPKRHMPPTHPLMHATRSIDYAIILHGEIDMLVDEGEEVHLKAGDVVIQQATNHAWINRSKDFCRIAFVLIDSQEP